MPEVNTEVFQIFLNWMKRRVGKNKKVILILDNANWHTTEKLLWGNITPLYLPTYSPDLNPIERIWLNMKETFFKLFMALNREELINRLSIALKYFGNNPQLCKSICGGTAKNE